jgi:hypothetical protein
MKNTTDARLVFHDQMAKLHKLIEIFAALLILATTVLVYAIWGRTIATFTAAASIVMIGNWRKRRWLVGQRRLKQQAMHRVTSPTTSCARQSAHSSLCTQARLQSDDNL